MTFTFVGNFPRCTSVQDITLQHWSFLTQFASTVIGHIFHQYEQNQQSPIISTELIGHEKTTVYIVGNACQVLGQSHNVAVHLGKLPTNVNKTKQNG
jgi:hypothetical protein